MKHTAIRWTLGSAACALVAALLSGCGGGGGGVTGLVDAASGSTVAAPVVPLFGMPDANQAVMDPAVADAAAGPSTGLAPNAAIVVRTYTPAQIRTAYQMPVLPPLANMASWTADQKASMGAGQTIYIVAAYDDPNIATELQRFNSQFGLPTCAPLTLANNQSLPLTAAVVSEGCTFAKVYAASAGTMGSTAPAYDAGWASEIALDVQWAHATAPMARIILIEAADASQTSISDAITLANNMGPGVVSMSFGVPEDSTTSSMDTLFSTAGMTYVAAAGDTGVSTTPLWPAISSKVMGVGGTSLKGYTSAGLRTETAWSSTGGGVSQYVTTPDYQSGISQAATHRSISDVSFNADPYTGQYVITIDPGTQRAKWSSMGGTSLGTPQWAGMVAVINAKKALSSQGSIGLVQSVIYPARTQNTFYGVTGTFADITSGASNNVSAGTGYDIPTGLGTPNLSGLLTLTTGAAGSTAPVVNAQSITATVNSALTIAQQYTSQNAVTWSLSGAPAGMTINAATGQISWTPASTGSYSVTVTALDGTNHLSGSAVISITVQAAAGAPTPVNVGLSGNAGTALQYNFPTRLRFSSANFTYVLSSGALPNGASLSTSGQLAWATPVQGSYNFSISASNGADVVAVYNVTLAIGAALQGPNISSAPISGTAASPLVGNIGISDPDANVTRINVAISGAPAGMRFAGVYQGLQVQWRNPVAGTYTLAVTATDATPGHGSISNTTNVTVTIR